MRLFLGIDIPQTNKDSIDEQLVPIRKEYPQLAWVPKHNYHVTVEFFGEVNIDKQNALIHKIEDMLYDQEEFHLFAGESDLFINNKLTIYLNFLREKKLEALVERVRETAALDNLPRKKFVAHLSLAKSRIFSKQQYFVLKKKVEKLSIDAEFAIQELVLFESDLQGKEPQYKKIHTFPLLKK